MGHPNRPQTDLTTAIEANPYGCKTLKDPRPVQATGQNAPKREGIDISLDDSWRTNMLTSVANRWDMFSKALFSTRRPFLKDNVARWAFIAIVGLVSAVGLRQLNVTIVWNSLCSAIEFDILLVLSVVIYKYIGTKAPGLGWSTAVVGDLLLSILQLIVALKAFTPLTYLAAASGYPLLDSTLIKVDAIFFGFDWNVEANWVANHPTLDWLLQQAYFSIYYQAALVFLIGSVSRTGDRNGEIIWQFCISLVLTCAVFVFTPALGHVAHIGTGWMKTLTMIRSGKWTAFDFSHVEGIISFPSFHTTLAILLVYAVRHHSWALAILVPLNMLLIIGTLSVGGHYLVDLPAGAAVAVISIAVVRLIRRQLAAGYEDSASGRLETRRGGINWAPTARAPGPLTAIGAIK